MQKIPGLWKHTKRPISFTLVVNNFGVKYMCQDAIDHLIRAIKEKYELTGDCDGNLYCGICLKQDYSKCTLEISIPGYILKQLKNTNTIAQNVPNTAHTLHCQSNTEAKPSVLSPRIHLPHHRRTISSKCSASSEASSITPKRWTSLFSWPTAQSPANNQRLPAKYMCLNIEGPAQVFPPIV